MTMIDLRANCVLQCKMNENAATPWVNNKEQQAVELVSNTDFADNSIWDWSAANWSWVSPPGRAMFQVVAPGPPLFGNLIQDIGAVNGKKYVVVYVVAGLLGAVTVTPYVGGTAGTTRSANGIYTEIITAGAGNSNLIFSGYTPGATGTLYVTFAYCVCLTDYPRTGAFKNLAGCKTSENDITGKINGGLDFGGTGADHIKVFDEGAVEFPNATDDFTIAVWLKRDRTTWIEHFLDKRDDSNDGWVFYSAYPWPTFRIQTTEVWVDAEIPADGQWHFVCLPVHRTSGNTMFYVDNVAHDDAPQDLTGIAMSISRPMVLGDNSKTQGSPFSYDGGMDNVMIFDKCLSEAEMDFLWNGGDGTEHLVGVARSKVGASLVHSNLLGKGLI